MKYIGLLTSVLFFVMLSACDPENCRDCETINYDIAQWSISDDIEKKKLLFEDKNQLEYIFELIDVEFSEPYNECQFSSTPEDVVCKLSKTLIYSSTELDLEFKVVYNQFQDLGTNDVTPISYGFKRLYDSLFYEIGQPLYWPTSQSLLNLIMNEVDSFEIGGQHYKEVLTFKPRFMIDPITKEEVNPIYIDSLWFQVPNGLIGISTMEYGELILKE